MDSSNAEIRQRSLPVDPSARPGVAQSPGHPLTHAVDQIGLEAEFVAPIEVGAGAGHRVGVDLVVQPAVEQRGAQPRIVHFETRAQVDRVGAHRRDKAIEGLTGKIEGARVVSGREKAVDVGRCDCPRVAGEQLHACRNRPAGAQLPTVEALATTEAATGGVGIVEIDGLLAHPSRQHGAAKPIAAAHKTRFAIACDPRRRTVIGGCRHPLAL